MAMKAFLLLYGRHIFQRFWGNSTFLHIFKLAIRLIALTKVVCFVITFSRIHEERSEHHLSEGSTLKLDAEECVLCVGANKRQPIQMWNDSNVAWPGRLTLTNMALYFEVSLNMYIIYSLYMYLFSLWFLHVKISLKNIDLLGSVRICRLDMLYRCGKKAVTKYRW
mgnify:CR=1 FL=1